MTVVIGVDAGTTGVRAIAFDPAGAVLATGEAGYPLLEPRPGWAEQDPEAVLDAVGDAVRAAVAGADSDVAALAFSSAMHGLIGIDAGDRPLTPLVTWADTRAIEQAARLRSEHPSCTPRPGRLRTRWLRWPSCAGSPSASRRRSPPRGAGAASRSC